MGGDVKDGYLALSKSVLIVEKKKKKKRSFSENSQDRLFIHRHRLVTVFALLYFVDLRDLLLYCTSNPF